MTSTKCGVEWRLVNRNENNFSSSQQPIFFGDLNTACPFMLSPKLDMKPKSLVMFVQSLNTQYVSLRHLITKAKLFLDCYKIFHQGFTKQHFRGISSQSYKVLKHSQIIPNIKFQGMRE